MSEQKREVVFTFGTTAAAIQGEKTLEGAGLPIRVMPLPDSIGAGCGICLRVDVALAPKALELLEQVGGKHQSCYLAGRDQGKTRYTIWNP